MIESFARFRKFLAENYKIYCKETTDSTKNRNVKKRLILSIYLIL